MICRLIRQDQLSRGKSYIHRASISIEALIPKKTDFPFVALPTNYGKFTPGLFDFIVFFYGYLQHFRVEFH